MHYGTYITSLQHATVTVLLAKCLILAAEKGAAKGELNFLEDSQARCASVLRGVARTVGMHSRGEGSRPGSARGILGGIGGLLKSSLWGEENWKLQADLLPVRSDGALPWPDVHHCHRRSAGVPLECSVSIVLVYM